MSLQHFK